MPFNVVLAKNAKVNGKRYKAGQTAVDVSDELFEELEERGLVTSYDEVEGKQDDDNLPDYKKSRLTKLKNNLLN